MPSPTTTAQVVIGSRFCGPPKSGNGGYVCGMVAAHVAGAALVRLKAPPPLETGLRIEAAGSGVRLLDGEAVIAEAVSAPLALSAPAAPSFADAEAAAKAYPGFARHPFPRCFVCGPSRTSGDGLRIFPGLLASGPMVAAPWVPDASLAGDDGKLRSQYLWAALDCTGGFALMPVPEGKAIVLGELHARIDGDAAAGDPCIALGWPLQAEGRKRMAGSAVYSASGRVIAVARATWIEVPLSAFGGH